MSKKTAEINVLIINFIFRTNEKWARLGVSDARAVRVGRNILLATYNDGSCNVQSISDIEGISPSSVRRKIKLLTKAGLVRQVDNKRYVFNLHTMFDEDLLTVRDFLTTADKLKLLVA